MTQVIENPAPNWVARATFLDVASPLPGLTEKGLDGVVLLHDGLEARTVHVDSDLDACTDLGPETHAIDACFPATRIFKSFRLWDNLESSPLTYTIEELRRFIDDGWDAAVSYSFAKVASAMFAQTAIAPPLGFSFGSSSVTVPDAIASLEEALAAALVGRQGTIHMGRGALLQALPFLERDGDRWFTPAGTKIIADAGYSPMTKPVGQADPGGMEQWLYGTGEVFAGSLHETYRENNANQWTDIGSNTIHALKAIHGLVAFPSAASFAVLATLDSNKVQP